MDINKEEWRPVKGFEDDYEVSNIGRIRSIEREFPIIRNGKNFTSNRKAKYRTVIISPSSGYCFVTTHRRFGNAKLLLVHRLVAQAFIPNPENKPCVNHKNSTRTDNRVENLEWCTSKENAAHKVEMKRHIRGSLHKLAKINEDIAMQIFNSVLTVKETADKFNTSTHKVYEIKRKKSWKHIHAA